MPPGRENHACIARAMREYTTDREVQVCGIWHGVLDIEAIDAAIGLCGQAGMRYVIPLLASVTEYLSTPTIQFLMQLDRADAVDVLLLHLERKSADFITNQFRLCCVPHVLLGVELNERGMWLPRNLTMTCS